MNTQSNTLPILLTLAAFLGFPIAAASEICSVEIDTPALVTVESASEIALVEIAGRPVILEQSPAHLVIAARRPGILLLESSTSCDVRTKIERAEVRERVMASGSSADSLAVVTAFHPLQRVTKEEDHEIDPDPKNAAMELQARPLLTLIHLGRAVLTKKEDHASEAGRPSGATYPDPKCGTPTKEEDHEIDPDPKHRGVADACGWTRDWNAAAAVVGQLGPGWYFVVQGGEVTQEILIDPRS